MFSRRFILLILLLPAFASSASAVGTASGDNVSGVAVSGGTLSSMRTILSVGNYNQSSGEILIPVMIDTTDRIGNLQFKFKYVGPCRTWVSTDGGYGGVPAGEFRYTNDGILNITDVIRGSLAEGSLLDWTNFESGFGSNPSLGCNSTLSIGLVSSSGINGSGSVVGLIYNVTGSRYYRESTYAYAKSFLIFESASANRAGTFEPIGISVRNGSFMVGDNSGDCNGDGRITSVDSLLVLKHSIRYDYSYYYPSSACDVDGNGKLETVDAARILKMVLEQPIPARSVKTRSG